MNPKNKAKERQQDKARAKEKTAASKEHRAKASAATSQESLSADDKRDAKRSLKATVDKELPYVGLVGKKFLTPKDGKAFDKLIDDHYQGFVHVPADELTPSNFHQAAKAALERLRDANYFQYDIVTAGGKHSSRTFVKRTLVGEPGITYKYLGLRLFAHAWSGPGVLPVMKSIGDLNKDMIQMTKRYDNHGKCAYNLTLINYMEPTSHTRVGFKDEAHYGMGKVSVSWHADSSLENESSIGVYHCLPTQRSSKWDWRIALRRSPESGADPKAVLPISVSTKDGDAYFLLAGFNESHQHCVLAGSESNRISSTHRVAVTEEDTYQYMLKRTKGALKRFRLQMEGEPSQMNPKVMIFCQRVLTELEMEWIAQYWLQGAEHDKSHVWWQRPMKTLESFWGALEDLTFQLYQICQKKACGVPRTVIKGLLTELTKREEQRQQWDERREDKIYQRRITPDFRPVARPLFVNDSKTQLGKDLTNAIEELSQVVGKRGSTTPKNSSSKSGNKARSKLESSDPNLTAKAGCQNDVSIAVQKNTEGNQDHKTKQLRTDSQKGQKQQPKRPLENESANGRKKKRNRKSQPVL